MGSRRLGRPRLHRLVLPVRHRLLVWVLLAAALGLSLPQTSDHLTGLVPVLLGGQVLGVALNITPGEIRAAGHRLPLVGTALATQWTVIPLIGLGLHLLAPSPVLAAGLVICAAAPAEITSALMAAIAGGDAAIATACLAGSLALATVLTPLWVSVGLGPRARVDPLGLALELVFSVLLPLVLGVSLRARLPVLARWHHVWLDLSAACLVLVVLVGSGRAGALLLTGLAPATVLLVAALLAGSGAAGWGLGRALRLPHRQATAVGFPIGIREFGVAIAVAVAVAPRASAVGGVYGILMVATAGTLASWLGRRRAPAERTAATVP